MVSQALLPEKESIHTTLKNLGIENIVKNIFEHSKNGIEIDLLELQSFVVYAFEFGLQAFNCKAAK